MNDFSSISSLIGHVFSVFRREKYAPNASKMDIKVLIPAPTQKTLVKSQDRNVFQNMKRSIKSSELSKRIMETNYCMLQIYMVSLCVVEVHFWSGTRPVPSSFLNSTSWFLVLAGEFRNGYVSACSTAQRSAVEINELSGYGNVPYLAKMTQHSSTADWIRFK